MHEVYNTFYFCFSLFKPKHIIIIDLLKLIYENKYDVLEWTVKM